MSGLTILLSGARRKYLMLILLISSLKANRNLGIHALPETSRASDQEQRIICDHQKPNQCANWFVEARNQSSSVGNQTIETLELINPRIENTTNAAGRNEFEDVLLTQNDTLLLASSIEPLYYGGYPQFRHGFRDYRPYNPHFSSSPNPVYNPLGSFYSLDESPAPSAGNNPAQNEQPYPFREPTQQSGYTGQRNNPLQSVLLQAYGFGPANNVEPKQEHPYAPANNMKPAQEYPMSNQAREILKKHTRGRLVNPQVMRQFDLSRLYGIKQEWDNLHRYRVHQQQPVVVKEQKQPDEQPKEREPPPRAQKAIESPPSENKKPVEQVAVNPPQEQAKQPQVVIQNAYQPSSSNEQRSPAAFYNIPLQQNKPPTSTKGGQPRFSVSKMHKPRIYARPAPHHRPMQVNLSSLIQPGEALVSEKVKSAGLQPSVASGSVSVDEIVSFLQRLRPLAISEKDKPESEQVPAEIEQDDDLVDDDGHIDKEDLEELKRQNRLTRVLPTSHLFGGSVGLVNESRISDSNEVDSDVDEFSDSEDARRPSASDDAVFLKNLAELSSKLSQPDNEPRKIRRIREFNVDQEQLDQLHAGGTGNGYSTGGWVPNLAHSNNQQVEDSGEEDEELRASARQRPQQQQQIPIEQLVDKLMSSSRLATFGLQHEIVPNDPSQVQEEEVVGDDDDEEDEEEEEDENNADQNAEASQPVQVSIVPGAQPMSTSESELNGAKLFPQRREISFSSVLNRNDSWIPIDTVTMTVDKANEVAGRTGQGERGGDEGTGAVKKKRRKKKRRRKKRKKGKRNDAEKKNTKNGDLVLVIGNNVLSRTDLIRLIGVLNKMASKREPSRERDASRRLLRFLVKLALEEYKKNKLADKKSGLTNSRDPIRDVLRSVLNGPVDVKPLPLSDNDTSIELSPEPPAQGFGKEANSRWDNGNLNDEGDVRYGDPKSLADPGLGKSLNEMSEDLEKYFDKDFFEDLADKGVKNNSDAAIKVLHRREPKLRRASRSGYALPVPIYGTKQVEAADEEDVELDHVRVPALMRARRLPSGRRYTPIRIRRRRPQRRRKAKEGKPKEEEEDEEEEEEEAEPEKVQGTADPEQEEPRSVRVREGRRRSDQVQVPRSVVNQASVKSDADETVEDSAAVDPDEEPDPEPVVKADESGTAVDEEPAAEEDNNEDQNGEPDERTKQVHRKKRRRRRKRRGNFIKKPIPAVEVDLDRRDEIPPPITGGKYRGPPLVEWRKNLHEQQDKKDNSTSPTVKPTAEPEKPKSNKKASKKESEESEKETNKRKEGKIKKSNGKNKKKKKKKKPSSVSDQKKDIEDNIEAIEEAEDLTKVKDARMRRDRSEQEELKPAKKDRDKRKKSAIKRRDGPSGELATGKPTNSDKQQQHNPEEDEDYYNEGTSYSKVCDDDGKCQVSVQSSSPTLSKAIKARDKPTIVKHLGKWVEKSN